MKASVTAKLDTRSLPGRPSQSPVRVEESGEAEASPPTGAGTAPTMATGGGYSGPLVYRQGKPMRPDVAAAFDRMAAAAQADGIALVINSAFRSDAEQAELWEQNPDPRWVAPPGPRYTAARQSWTWVRRPPTGGWRPTRRDSTSFSGTRGKRGTWSIVSPIATYSMGANMSKKLAGYVRVSHVGRRKGKDSFHSPDDQKTEIERWAKGNGHLVEMLPPELDAKGNNPDRPTFRQAVDGVKSGEYAGIVVAYLSRAGRDLRLMLDLWEEIEQAGGVFYSAKENIDASTRSGRLHRNILASIAQDELEARREGFEEARQGAVERAIWKQPQTPLGYDKDPESRKLIPNDDAPQVERAFDDYLRTGNISNIATRLGMTTSGVRQMLRNRVYLGEYRIGEHLNAAAFEPIIERETFAAVQAKLDANVRPARNGNAITPLAGLVRCAGCGHVMTRNQSNGHRTYSCPKRHSGATCPAPAAIMSERLEEYVLPVALAELDRLKVTAKKNGGGVARARKKLTESERRRDQLHRALDIAKVGAEHFAAAMRDAVADVEADQKALDAELARQPAMPKVGTGAEVWDDLNSHERNDLLRALLSAVVVVPAGRGGRTIPVPERVRILRHGASVRLPTNTAGTASGIVPITPADLDDEDVLGVAPSKNGAKRPRRVR